MHTNGCGQGTGRSVEDVGVTLGVEVLGAEGMEGEEGVLGARGVVGVVEVLEVPENSYHELWNNQAIPLHTAHPNSLYNTILRQM